MEGLSGSFWVKSSTVKLLLAPSNHTLHCWEQAAFFYGLFMVWDCKTCLELALKACEILNRGRRKYNLFLVCLLIDRFLLSLCTFWWMKDWEQTLVNTGISWMAESAASKSFSWMIKLEVSESDGGFGKDKWECVSGLARLCWLDLTPVWILWLLHHRFDSSSPSSSGILHIIFLR